MLALSVILTFVITPLIISLGRSIDFVPRNPPWDFTYEFASVRYGDCAVWYASGVSQTRLTAE
jgi:hypothetical protein